MISARITPATPQRESEAVRAAFGNQEQIAEASITRPDISRISPSAKAGSCHSARASTCSRRFRCLIPASRLLGQPCVTREEPNAASRHAALGRPEARAEQTLRPTRQWQCIAALAGATGDDQLGDARPSAWQNCSSSVRTHRCRGEWRGVARLRPGAGHAPSRRARPPVTRIVSNNPSP